MKKRTITLAVLAALTAASSVQASEFAGGFVGARAGVNRSDIPNVASSARTSTYGLDGGYNWDVRNFLLGLDAYADSNNSTNHNTVTTPINYGSKAYGVDLKLGLPMGSWMPYGRLGYAKTNSSGASTVSSGGVHGGVGIEYKFTPSWGVNAEWVGSNASANGFKLNNDNLTLGIHYYFGAPAAAVPAPQPVAVKEEPKPAPVVVKEEPKPVATREFKPEPAPVAQPKESWKTILTERPVRLEGANFATNSAKLLKRADVKLNEVVNAAKQYPEVKLEVSGHTDNRGKKALNQKLSEHRAASVKAWLVKHGVAADRISTAGYADTKPIADNKTAAGRAANRRVEVKYVVKEEKKVRVE